MQLPEAVAVGLTTQGQVGADADHKEQQKDQRPDGAPPGRCGGHESTRHGQLGERQHESERAGKGGRKTKVG